MKTIDISDDVTCWILGQGYELEAHDVWAARNRAIIESYYEDGTSCEDGEPMLLTDRPEFDSDLPDYF